VNGTKPSTPCVGQCRIDAFFGLCAGCGRSRAEIAGWKAMSEAERLAIMAVLARRAGGVSVQGVADRRELVGDLCADGAEGGDQAG
jgi:predicted Fe-S protein YdhL (DUF1289 family)